MDAASLHQLLNSLDDDQLQSLPIDLIDIIASDRTLITYRPRLNALTGSVTATILLQQIMFWWAQNRRPFYKFKEPCGHADYREGDSWTEELGFSKHEFDTALKKIAAKISRKRTREQAEHALVFYWTDMQRKTWYEINEPRLRGALIQLYRREPPPPPPPSSPPDPGDDRGTPGSPIYVNPESGDTKIKKADSRKSKKRADVNPDSRSRKSRKAGGGKAATSLHEKPQSGSGNLTENNGQRVTQKTSTEKDPAPPPASSRPRAEGGEEEEVDRIQAMLEREGVFAGPAREIATRAAGAGLGVRVVRKLFRHELEESGRIELAIYRLREGALPDATDDDGAIDMDAVGEEGLRQQAFLTLLDEHDADERDFGPAPPRTLWERALVILRDQVTRATFEHQLLGSRQLSFEDGELCVALPTEEAQAWLEGPRKSLVVRALAQLGDERVERVRFVVDPTPRP